MASSVEEELRVLVVAGGSLRDVDVDVGVDVSGEEDDSSVLEGPSGKLMLILIPSESSLLVVASVFVVLSDVVVVDVEVEVVVVVTSSVFVLVTSGDSSELGEEVCSDLVLDEALSAIDIGSPTATLSVADEGELSISEVEAAVPVVWLKKLPFATADMSPPLSRKFCIWSTMFNCLALWAAALTKCW